MGQVKTCYRCKIEKPHSEFYPNGDGLQAWCKCCMKEYRRTNRGRRKLVDRAGHLRRKFGITLDEFDAMLGACSGLCAICSGSVDVPNGCASVDHCHKTGKVRGLLCGHCNRGLGLFQDRTDVLHGAIRYLEEHTSEGNADSTDDIPGGR